MARIRTIKPQHVEDKELPNISLQAHLLWILSWCFSDDEGILEADPLFIKSKIFPRRTDIRVEQVVQWLDQLVKARYIIPFTYNGEGYYLHRTFRTHQKIDRKQESKIPLEIIRRTLDECSTNVRANSPLYSNVEESISNNLSTIVESPSPAKPKVEIFKQKTDDTAKKAWEQLIPNLPTDNKEKKQALGDFIRQYRPDFIEPYATLWNLFAAENKLRQVEHLTDKRKKKIKLRAAETAFDFVAMLIEIKKSPFARGDNSRGWRVDFDYLLESESNYIKILEGKFEG